MSDNIPKKHEITDYWKDKAIDKQTFKVVEYKGRANVIPVVRSTLYSRCWACNIHSYDEYENYYTFEQTWDCASYLERCHILPKMLGGGNEASNLFLLCKKCHYESPDTINKDNFFAWVIYKRENEDGYEMYRKNLKKAAKMKGYDLDELEDQLPDFYKQQDGFRDEVSKRLGLHFNDVSEMSVCMSEIDVMVKWAEERHKNER